VIYQFNNIELDTDNFRLLVDNQETPVEPQVFNLIILLIENKHMIVSRGFILEHIWKDRVVSDTSINNHIMSARKVLGDDGTMQKVIKTIHSRGYQFVAECKQVNDSAQEDNKPRNKQDYTREKKQFSKPKVLMLGLVFILLSTIFLLLQNRTKPEIIDSSIYKVAVMPFLNSNADSNTDYFGFALADQIIGAMNYFENISVRPSSSVRKYTNHEYTLEQVRSDLDIDYILSGHYLTINNDIRLNIELVNLNTNEIVWRGEPIQANFNNTFNLQDMAVKQVVKGLKIKFSTQNQRRIRKDIPNNPLAYEFYLRSIAYPYTTDGHRLAIKMLKQAIVLDEQFAPNYVQLGNRIRRLSQYGLVDDDLSPDTEHYYLKALSINPDLLDAMAYLSMYYTESNRIDEAINLARYMQQLNPNNANTHFTLGYIYRYAGMLDEAIDEMEKAVYLDSKNIKFRSLIGTYSATSQYQKALEMTELYDPSPFTYGWKALMNMRLGNTEKSLELFDFIIENYPKNLWANVAIIHKSYLQKNPELGLNAISSLVNTPVSDGETIYYTSAYYGLLGENTKSIKLLRKAINEGYFNYRNILTNDYFEQFKSDPEFQTVLNEAKTKHMAFQEKYFPDK